MTSAVQPSRSESGGSSNAHHDQSHPFGPLTSASHSQLPSLKSVSSISLATSCTGPSRDRTQVVDNELRRPKSPSITSLPPLPSSPLPALERAGPSAIFNSSLELCTYPPVSSDQISNPGSTQHPQPKIPGDEVTTPGLALPVTHPRHFLDNRSMFFKALFLTTTCSAQFLAQGQFGMVVLPLTDIGNYLGATSPGELSWMAASYGLTVGMFLVASGRLGDLYGPKLMWLLGYVIIIISNIASGFCKTRIPFDICRALAGIGAAFSLPNAVAILGRTYPPGPTRSITFAMLGAIAPAGWFAAGAMAAAIAEKASVPWIWFFTALMTAGLALLGVYVLPPDDPLAPASARKQFDYLGTLLLVAALGQFNFAWNQAPLVGWVRNIQGATSSLSLVAHMSPLCPGGITAALIVPSLLTRFPGHQIFFVSMVAFFVGDLMGALAPATNAYWKVTFPSLLLVIWGPDLSFSTGQLIVSNSVDREFQGIAGGIVSMITNYSLSVGLGMAGTVEAYVAPNGPLLKGYRAAFYFGTGLAFVAVLVVGLFVRMPKMAQYRE